MSTLEGYIAKFGPELGAKFYHIVRSRAAYKGVSTKRRQRIEALTGRAYRPRRKASPVERQGLLSLSEPAAPLEPEQAAV